MIAAIHATGRFPVAERLAHEREQLRPLPPTAFDFAGALQEYGRLVKTRFLLGYLADETGRGEHWNEKCR